MSKHRCHLHDIPSHFLPSPFDEIAERIMRDVPQATLKKCMQMMTFESCVDCRFDACCREH
jgi:hypothetical protein